MCWISSKLKTTAFRGRHEENWKDRPESKRKYLQIINLITDLYLHYLKLLQVNNKKPNLKTGNYNRHFFQRKYYEWLISTQRVIREMQFYSLGWLSLKRQTVIFGEDVEKLKSSHTADGKVKWCSHFGKWFGCPSKC